MYKKLDIIHPYRNQTKMDFKLQLLNIFLEEKRWIHANPTLYDKGEFQDKYKKYYIENEELVDDFYSALTGSSKFVILRGKRGSGKTSFLNYFLNKKTRELNAKGLTWIRIDTTKIYKNRVSFMKDIDFETYLYAQLLFVYFRYKGNGDSVCETEFRCPQKSFSLSSCDKVFSNIDLEQIIGNDSILRQMYERAKKGAEETSHFNNSYDGKCFECSELGKKLYEVVADKLIVIVDGIDNINYNSSIKHAVWEDLEKFLNHIQNTHIAHKLVLALRTENFEILSSRLDYLDIDTLKKQNDIDINIPDMIDLKPIALKKVIDRFKETLEKVEISDYTEESYIQTLQEVFRIYQNYLSQKLQRIKKDLTPQEYIELKNISTIKIDGLDRKELEAKLGSLDLVYDTSLALSIKKGGYHIIKNLEKAIAFLMNEERKYDDESFGKRLKEQMIGNYFKYASQLEETIKDTIEERIERLYAADKEFDLITDLFNGDLRELFILSCRSYTYLIGFARFRDKGIYRFHTISHYMEGRRLQIIQAVFQNGNRYHGSRDDIIFYPPYRNINFINLFNILDSKNQTASPLIALYLLKYLYKKEKSKADIEGLLSDYENIPVDKILNEFLEFGYLKIEKDDNTSQLHYTATSKAKNILDYSLTNLNVIQSYIYGGLVPSEHQGYFRVWYDHNYASQLLFNVLLYWYELKMQEEELKKLYAILSIEFEPIPQKAKEGFVQLAKSFPEHHAFSDIDSYTKGEKELAEALKVFYRQITFVGSHYDELYHGDQWREFASLLSEDEKIIYAYSYLNKKNDRDIVDNTKLSHFVFGDADIDKENERLRKIKEVLESSDYWHQRDELRRRLEKIKRHIG